MLELHPENSMEQYLCERAFQTHTPISGTFELLPICNMDCKMCYIRTTPSEMKRQGRMLSAKEWLDIGKQAAGCGTMFLLLTGGEPLLHPEFITIFEGLRNLGICVTINTNGTLITPEVVDVFRGNLPRRVNVSLYGSSDEVYRELCGNPHGFTQTIHGIRMLKEAGIPVKLNFTLTPQNRFELEAVTKISNELQIPVSIPTYIFPPARKDNVGEKIDVNRLTPEQAAAEQVHILHNEFGCFEDYENNITDILERIDSCRNRKSVVKEPPGGFLCSAGASSFWINWKGEMTACGMMTQPLSDLKKKDFHSAWKYIEEESSKIITSSKCFYCEYRSICQNCAASSLAETGACNNEVSYHCRMCMEYEKLLREHLKQHEEKEKTADVT